MAGCRISRLMRSDVSKTKIKIMSAEEANSSNCRNSLLWSAKSWGLSPVLHAQTVLTVARVEHVGLLQGHRTPVLWPKPCDLYGESATNPISSQADAELFQPKFTMRKKPLTLSPLRLFNMRVHYSYRAYFLLFISSWKFFQLLEWNLIFSFLVQ